MVVFQLIMLIGIITENGLFITMTLNGVIRENASSSIGFL
jgi:hypothetical protein